MGWREQNVEISDNALLGVIRHYTKEAGVRNLEREIAVDLPQGRRRGGEDRPQRARAGAAARALAKYLGPPTLPLRQGRGGQQDRRGDRPGVDRARAASCWPPR